MKPDNDARRALEPMRNRLLPVEAHDEAMRERVVGHLQGVLRLAPSQARARRAAALLAWGAAFATLGAAAGLLLWGRTGETPAPAPAALLDLDPRGQVEVTSAQEPLALRDRTQVAARGTLSTAQDASAAIVTPAGVEISVAGDSELRLDALADSRHGGLKLVRGRVECRVPKRRPGDTFSVSTPDATVEVRGTVFSVETPEGQAKGRTCVRVSEGLVDVHRDGGIERLAAGQSSGCASEPTTASVGGASDARAAAPPPPRSEKPRSPAAQASPVRGSLNEESALLRQALQAEQRGDAIEARRTIDVLLQKFPQSPLVPEARRVRQRLKAGPTR